MNSRTASYWPRVAGSIDRVSPGRLIRSSPLSWLGSGGAGSPGTGNSCSPETRRAARLVTIALIRGAVRSRSATTGAASATCSKLSSTSRTVLSRSQSASDSATGRVVPSTIPTDDAIRGDHQHRVADRLERDEEDAIRELVGDAGGQLQRQPRLAGPARPGEGQQAGRGEQAGGLGQLRVATDEGRQLGRQVVRVGIQRPGRRERRRQAVGVDLDQVDRGQQVAQPEGAQVAQADPVGQARRDQRAGRVRDEDLAAVGHRGDPRCLVDVEADEAIADPLRLAGMEAHPDPHRRPSRPGRRRQRPLARDRRGDGGTGLPERHEERVALGPLLIAVMRRPDVAQDRSMLLEEGGVALACRPPARAVSIPRCR